MATESREVLEKVVTAAHLGVGQALAFFTNRAMRPADAVRRGLRRARVAVAGTALALVTCSALVVGCASRQVEPAHVFVEPAGVAGAPASAVASGARVEPVDAGVFPAGPPDSGTAVSPERHSFHYTLTLGTLAPKSSRWSKVFSTWAMALDAKTHHDLTLVACSVSP